MLQLSQRSQSLTRGVVAGVAVDTPTKANPAQLRLSQRSQSLTRGVVVGVVVDTPTKPNPVLLNPLGDPLPRSVAEQVSVGAKR